MRVYISSASNSDAPYTAKLFYNTACAERRPYYNREEFREDFEIVDVPGSSDIEAFANLQESIDEYEDFVTPQEYIDFWNSQDLGDGSIVVIWVKRGSKYVYNSGLTMKDLW